MSAKNFEIQMGREFDAKIKNASVVVRAISVDALARIQKRSPVDTGRFRHNWIASIGNTDTSVLPEKKNAGKNSYPNDAAERGAMALAGYGALGGFPAVFLQNNLPYAKKLDSGYSKNQAPKGIIGLVVLELATKYAVVEL